MVETFFYHKRFKTDTSPLFAEGIPWGKGERERSEQGDDLIGVDSTK